MKEEKGKNIIIILLVVIIVMLLALCVLFATGTISFSSKTLNNNTENNENTETEVVDNNEIPESFSKNASDYVELVSDKIDGHTFNKISFKNLDNSLTQSFLDEQDIMLGHIQSFGEYNLTDGNTWFQVNGNILSVYYEILVSDEMGEQPHIVVTNIDLKNKKVLSDREVLALANGGFDQIALENYNELLPVIEKCEKVENNCHVLARGGGFITLKDYTENKDKYINNIINGLDDVIFCYIKDGIVKYDYQKVLLDNLFYINGKGGAFPYLTEEVGKYNY